MRMEPQQALALLAGLRQSSALQQIMQMFDNERNQARTDVTSQQQLVESQSRVNEANQRIAQGPIGLQQLAARAQQHQQSLEQGQQHFDRTFAFNEQRNIEAQAQADETHRLRELIALSQIQSRGVGDQQKQGQIALDQWIMQQRPGGGQEQLQGQNQQMLRMQQYINQQNNQ